MSSEHHPDQHAGRAAVAEPVAPVGRVVEFDDYIEAQLRKTQSHVRGVDAASAVMVWAAFTLVYVLLAALFDHWIVTGGLGFWGRALFLGLYLVLVAAFLILRVLPLAVRTINPLYAAHTIERSAPSLKNTLLNFLFLRGEQGRMSPAIFQAVEQQAATNLAGAHADAAVDRSKLIKIGYVLLASLLVCAVYALASPKDLFKTVGRIAVPWADINAPTQTTVSEVEPRDTLAFRGQQIAVSARINDLPEGAKALLYYSTADGQIVDRTIEMKLGPDGYKHACLLPADEATLQQDVDYRIEAGDAITRAYHVEVIAAPKIFVEAVEYKYPAYTGLLAQRVERQGDLRGIEGTAVTLDAVANADIETAHVDFDCDGTLDQRMTVDGLRAKATFRLALANDRKSPWHSSYQLIFKNQRGQQNPQPVRQQIEVTRDIPPEIDFVSPRTDEVAVPLNGTAILEIVATDPDFALRLVKLSASKGREPLFDKLLLDEVHRGQFVGKHRIEPSKLGLKAGDVVEYTALAEDNKDAPANRTQTVTRRIRIVPPQAARDGQNQAGDDQQGGQGQQQDNQRGDDQGERRDRDDMPPDGDGQARGEQDEPDNQPGEAGEPGGQQGTARSPQADRGDKPEGADQRGEQAQQDQQTPGDKPNPDDRKSDQRDAEPSDGQQSDKQQGEGKQEQGQPGAGQQGKGQSGHDQQGQDQQGQSQQGRGQQGKGKGQKGDGQQGAGQQNEQQGEGQQGQSQQQSGGESRQGGDQRRQQDEPAPGVASDGSNDGDAIERILNHRDQQQPGEPPKPGDQSRDQREGAQSPQKQRNQANSRDQARKPGDQQAGKEPGDKQPADQPGQSDARQGQQSQPEKGAAQHGQQGDKQADQQGDQQQGGEKNPSQNDQPQPGADQDGQSERGPSEKGRQQDGQQPDAQSQEGQSEKAQPQKGQAENGQRGQQPMPGDKPPGNKSPNNKQQGEPQADGKREPAPQEDGAEAGKPAGDAPRDEGQGQGQSKEGQGAQAKSDPMGNQSAGGRGQQRKDAQGGDGEQQKGTSGAGQKSEDKQGSPSPQETAQPRDKSQQPSPNDSQGPKDQNQAQSPSQSKRESDSEGQDDGDRSGGGKRGGGQKANKSGTGGAGQNTAADEGAGASEEAGKGETSDRAGQDQAAQKPTGQSGSQQGPGSASKAGDDANRQGGDKNSPEAQGKPGESADKPQGGQSHPGGGTPRGGEPGQASDQQPAEQPYRTAPEAADEANLDYARKATDLALSHLKDELAKDQPDPNLLNKLGWTREELAQFVKRWEEMRANADAPGDTGQSARRQLDETLRSLGLRPRATNLRSNEARNDQTRGMRESRHTNAPAEYAEQTKAYTQGTARGGNGK